jgi:hypothetical protein
MAICLSNAFAKNRHCWNFTLNQWVVAAVSAFRCLDSHFDSYPFLLRSPPGAQVEKFIYGMPFISIVSAIERNLC